MFRTSEFWGLFREESSGFYPELKCPDAAAAAAAAAVRGSSISHIRVERPIPAFPDDERANLKHDLMLVGLCERCGAKRYLYEHDERWYCGRCWAIVTYNDLTEEEKQQRRERRWRSRKPNQH